MYAAWPAEEVPAGGQGTSIWSIGPFIGPLIGPLVHWYIHWSIRLSVRPLTPQLQATFFHSSVSNHSHQQRPKPSNYHHCPCWSFCWAARRDRLCRDRSTCIAISSPIPASLQQCIGRMAMCVPPPPPLPPMIGGVALRIVLLRKGCFAPLAKSFLPPSVPRAEIRRAATPEKGGVQLVPQMALLRTLHEEHSPCGQAQA